MYIQLSIFSIMPSLKWGGVIFAHSIEFIINYILAIPNRVWPFIAYRSGTIIILSAIVSFLSVNWVFNKVLRIANIKSIVDKPNPRKLQSTPVPVMGGIAIFFGLVSGLFAYGVLSSIGGQPIDTMNSSIGTVMIASSILLYIGALDDIFDLSPLFRLVVQVLVVLGVILRSGMSIDSLHGLWDIEKIQDCISLFLTIITCVGIINAYNMIDGVNGLSSGLCIALSCIIGIIFFKRFDYENAAFAFCYAVSLVPFYLHNVFGRESKMFIGDAGTMVMGILVSWFIIRVLSSQSVEAVPEQGREMCLVALMLAVVSVPVADTLRVMMGRIFSGRSPFSPDQTHLHHAFIAVGLGHFITHLSEIAINLLIVAIWLVSYRSGLSQEVQLYITVVSAGILVWGTYFFLHYQIKHETKTFVNFKNRFSSTYLWNKVWWKKIQRLIDEV